MKLFNAVLIVLNVVCLILNMLRGRIDAAMLCVIAIVLCVGGIFFSD